MKADELKNPILDCATSLRDEMLEFTKTLIAVPTENPPGRAYRECVILIERKLQEIGLDCRIMEISENEIRGEGGAEENPRGYVLQCFHGHGKRILYFHGHYDVVPAAHGSQFSPRIRNGRLYGRGSADMKGGLTSMIYALKILRESGLELKGRIGLTIVPDEETGGAKGSRFLVRRGLLGREGIGMMTAEPTGGVVWNANRGAVSLRVTVRGRPAHVGLHYQGVNAFEHMLEVAAALRELKSRAEVKKTAFRIEPEAARHSILLLGGECGGGTSFNSVPRECAFTIDRRINPEENLEEEKQILLDLLEKKKSGGIDLMTEILQEGESSGIPEDDPLAQTLAHSVELITGRRPAFEMCPGLLEIRFYAGRGIPAFAYGPGLLTVSHGPSEYVAIQNIVECAAVYALTAAERLGS